MVKKSIYSTILVLILLITTTAFASTRTIEIKRVSYNSASITGELFVDDKFISHTLELPWENNKSFISSIPSGTYSAILRYDKNDKWRLQLKGVPKREGIQLHIGNYPSDIQGCILVGRKVENSVNSINESVESYKDLKRAFYDSVNPIMTPNVNLVVKISYYPDRTHIIGDKVIMNYLDQGLWEIGSAGNMRKFSEKHRDFKNIVFSISGGKKYLKVPLFGGNMGMSETINGPWSKGEKVKRTN
ncbi:MAG: hypothetical protein ACI8PB_004971 [Desulforhopalus sp.]|jgi:hypothetical protein